MQLNLVTLPSLIAAGLSSISCGSFNPKFGNVVAVNEDLFKYVISGPPKESFMFQRISLNELFEGIPQSIVGIKRQDWTPSAAVEVLGTLETDLVTGEPVVVETVVTDADEQTNQFHLWTQFIGLGALPRGDVELSSTDGWLHVDARYSPVFKGTVSIQVQETV